MRIRGGRGIWWTITRTKWFLHRTNGKWEYNNGDDNNNYHDLISSNLKSEMWLFASRLSGSLSFRIFYKNRKIFPMYLFVQFLIYCTNCSCKPNVFRMFFCNRYKNLKENKKFYIGVYRLYGERLIINAIFICSYKKNF